MFALTRPNEKQIREFLHAQKRLPFSYPFVGATRNAVSVAGGPRGFHVDHNRAMLGHGAVSFELAKQAIRGWRMFDMAWVTLCYANAPIEVGSTVGILIRHFGLWSLNSARIAYTLDDAVDDSVTQPRGGVPKRFRRYGFAYGTLPGHAEIGEERFSVEFHAGDESVWYDLYAFSRPSASIRAAYPLARSLQKRFARDSMLAMRRAVGLTRRIDADRR